MIKKGIRREIVVHYFLVVFMALLLVEVIFLLAVRTYYYDSVYSHIASHIVLADEYYQTYALRDKNTSIINQVISYFELYGTELQVLNLDGRILSSSNDFDTDNVIQTSDVTQALAGETSRWVGKQPGTNQIVMSVSKTLKNAGENQYILRYVTSLEKINDKLLNLTMLSILIGTAVLATVLAFSIGLANSIVKPINNIRAVSAQMAKGRFNVRVKGDYKYELGELASTLNYMAQEIVRSNQVKDDFISSISHELRTPLTSIKGWSETLNSGGYDPEETRIGMQIITKETDRLIGLVEEILDFSKLQQNEMKLVTSSVNLKELLQEIMLNMWAKAEKKGIKLNLVADWKPVIQGDANRLKQVFLNLVDNAVKFSHEHGTVDLTFEMEEGFVAVVVRDYGIGISEEHIQRVKDRFFQVNPVNGGTGLGLAITQQLVELHRGTLQMASELGQGTTVTVRLPLLEPQPQDMSVNDQQTEIEATASPSQQDHT
ncbi:integral membrane sensor signal transduction histidine kinase [Paenibacillus algicola]|uniref:histidine kinase n=1 Tax=Paenibacillus algicola TaxID=2565926 RepID=A0A4P8XMA1_9BACL|nr:HAMP domain-containing sensor histidine kinase [Paenibacillus algicola]QCT02800.1 integral membrane sensor signal transduction histidine kinase [Paenibacillus algicola]